MDQLARYVAGPLSLASLGVGLWAVDLPVPAFAAWVLAGVWFAASVFGWRNERSGLKGRAIRLANRIRRCVKGWWEHPDYEPHSTYGREVSMAKFYSGLKERQGKRVHPFWTLPYTKRLHRKVERVIEEMGGAGVVDYQLRSYLTQPPEPSQYDNFARDLWWAACKLPDTA
jgi:hypothetical protein